MKASAKNTTARTLLPIILFCAAPLVFSEDDSENRKSKNQLSVEALQHEVRSDFIVHNGAQMIVQGRQIFRYDSFGDQVFWGDTLQLHQTLANVTPRQALDLGLKIDAQALSEELVEKLKRGKVNLDDPAVTLKLLRSKAVLGVVGIFDTHKNLTSVGLTCAICHSTVNNSVAFGIGQRLDG